MNSIGNNLKAKRKEKGLKQKDLAKIMGVSPVVISQYESNKRNPKIETIYKFASALGCSIEDLGIYKTSLGYSTDFKEVDGMTVPIVPKTDLINASIEFLNDNGKQKVIDYIEDIKVNPKYKNNDL